MAHGYSKEEIEKYGYRLEGGSVLLPGDVMMDHIRRGVVTFRWGSAPQGIEARRVETRSNAPRVARKPGPERDAAKGARHD